MVDEVAEDMAKRERRDKIVEEATRIERERIDQEAKDADAR